MNLQAFIMLTYIVLEFFAAATGFLASIFVLWRLASSTAVRNTLFALRIPLAVIAFSFVLGIYAQKTYPPHFAMPAWMTSYGPHQDPPWLPFKNIFAFLEDMNRFDHVADIGRNPNDVPPPIDRKENELVKISMTVKEVISEVAPGIYVNYWTFNDRVPGPLLRVKENDTVELSLSNHLSSLHPHNIDLHAVTGPGGGSGASKVAPGETKTFRFKALNPGLYIYHCASMNVGLHETHGQYGLILVEPKEGLPKVDKEFPD